MTATTTRPSRNGHRRDDFVDGVPPCDLEAVIAKLTQGGTEGDAA